jgi:pimeloyl-ACP methyl ester carboxylesterase
MEQKLGSTRLPDGTTVAYATAGGGPFLLFIGGWLSHLELSWALPAERHLFEGLAHGRTIIRYDRPGCGLSDRPTQASASWNPSSTSLRQSSRPQMPNAST